MKTASFFTFTGAGRISIARSPPRNTPAGYRVYRPLMPGPWFNSVSREEYERLYAEQLAQLDPKKVWDDLHALHPGVEPTLLCYERPPWTATNFCHRRMAAEWFERELELDVPELEPAPKAPAPQLF